MVRCEIWRWESDPFGTTAANDDPDGDRKAFSYNLRFPGQYFDSETGLHYNYFRDYDPATGRYIESDPIGLDGGLNTYLYAESDPVKYTDPYGLCPFGGILCGTIGFGLLEGGIAVAGAWGLYNSTKDHDFVDDPAAAAEWNEYKDRYREPPPPDLDPCELLKWKLKREKRLLRDRQAWDRHWGRGTHAEAIRQSKNAIKNLKRKIKQECRDSCQNN